jgi:hypothetical protein
MRRTLLKSAVAFLTFAVSVTAFWFFPRLSHTENASPRRFANDIYFPAGTFLPDKLRENLVVEGYSNCLAAMDEPEIHSLVGKGVESYRFLYIRSFHLPVAIRLWEPGGEWRMVVKQLDGNGEIRRRDGGGEWVFPHKLNVNVTHTLTEGERDSFTGLLAKADFWNLPTIEEECCSKDGATWLMEGVKGRRYHVVDRQSPASGEYREACIYLLKISGLQFDVSRGEIY